MDGSQGTRLPSAAVGEAPALRTFRGSDVGLLTAPTAALALRKPDSRDGSASLRPVILTARPCWSVRSGRVRGGAGRGPGQLTTDAPRENSKMKPDSRDLPLAHQST